MNTEPTTNTNDPRALSFRQLFEEEDAQAMVEFVVLLPIYLLLITVMIYSGHIMLVRQQLVEASRWYAWESQQSTRLDVNRTFFPRFAGSMGSARLTRDNFNESGDSRLEPFAQLVRESVRQGGGQGSNEQSQTMAQRVLLDDPSTRGNTPNNRTNIERSKVEVQFDYTFAWFAGRWTRPTLGQSCSHSLYRYTNLGQKRRIPTGSGGHPFDLFTSNPPSGLDPFTVNGTGSDEGNPWEPLLMLAGNSFQLDQGSNHEGHACLWNTAPILGRNRGSPFYYHYYNDR